MYSFNNEKDQPSKGASLTRLANEDLTWETSEQLDLGFDARFLGGKLGLVFDWYKKTTKDLLLYVPVSPTTGFTYDFSMGNSIENIIDRIRFRKKKPDAAETAKEALK